MSHCEKEDYMEEIKSNAADCLTLHNLSVEPQKDIDMSQIQDEEKGLKGKPRQSNKERARRARLRKKKYYDDLEKRVNYLENKCQKLEKEVEYYKNKCSIFGGSQDQTGKGDYSGIENKLFERLEQAIMQSKDEDLRVISIYGKISALYGPFGTEKVKELDKSFDNFLENIFTGSNFKLYFYAADKGFPKNYTDYMRYIKLKKFKQHEEFPDQYVRELINGAKSYVECREDFNHCTKNKFPLVIEIREEMKEAMSRLFKAKDDIYKGLMKCDLFTKFLPNFVMNRTKLLSLLEETKHSNFIMPYK